MSLRQIARLSNQRFTFLCCTLENLNWLSQSLNLLIACYSNSLHVKSLRLHEKKMNYHFPDVSKQNRFHFIFLLLLKVLSLVLLKCKVQHIPSGEKSLIFGRVSDPCYEAEWRQKKYHWRYTTKWSSVLSHTTLRGMVPFRDSCRN